MSYIFLITELIFLILVASREPIVVILGKK